MVRPTYVILVLSQTGDKDGIFPLLLPPFPPCPFADRCLGRSKWDGGPRMGEGISPNLSPSLYPCIQNLEFQCLCKFILYNNKYSPSISVLEACIKGEVGTDLAL